jgi:hypothetical protein
MSSSPPPIKPIYIDSSYPPTPTSELSENDDNDLTDPSHLAPPSSASASRERSHVDLITDGPRYLPRPRRALQSFDNLVALANYHERIKALRESRVVGKQLREAKKMVWRDRGEPVHELGTVEECVRHAAKGGLSQSLILPILNFIIY